LYGLHGDVAGQIVCRSDCHDLGFDLVWMEKDPEYYAAALKRYQEHAAQATLFAPQELRAGNYAQLDLGGL